MDQFKCRTHYLLKKRNEKEVGAENVFFISTAIDFNVITLLIANMKR